MQERDRITDSSKLAASFLPVRAERSLAHSLLHSRTMGVSAVAGMLSVKTAMECHGALVLAHFDAPFLPSLLRALVVWYWWAIVALVLWALGERTTKLLRFSRQMILIQLCIGSALASLHMALLRSAVAVISVHWPVEASNYYSSLHVKQRTYLLRESLSDLELRLDPLQFLRVHRSALVNLDYVSDVYREGVREGTLTLKNGSAIRMSKTGRQRLRTLLEQKP